MLYKDIKVEKRGRITCLTLNRPERMNSISVETGIPGDQRDPQGGRGWCGIPVPLREGGGSS